MKERFTQLEPMWSNSVQRHIQYNVSLTNYSNWYSFKRLSMSWYIFKDQTIHSWCILKHFLKIVVSVSVIISNLHVNGRCSLKPLPSPSSLSKIPSFGVLSFLPLPFLLLLFSHQSSGRNLCHFQFFSLYLLSVSQIPRKGAGKENTVFSRWVRSSF